MSIKFSCPGCGKVLKTADEHAGKTKPCPGCGQAVTVPMTDTRSSNSSIGESFLPEEPPASRSSVRPKPTFGSNVPPPPPPPPPAPIPQPAQASVIPPSYHPPNQAQPVQMQPQFVVVHAGGETDTMGTISMVMGVLSMICVLMGCFTCGITYFVAIPLAATGAVTGFYAKGNMRVAGLILNILVLIPAVMIMIFTLGAGGFAGLMKAVDQAK